MSENGQEAAETFLFAFLGVLSSEPRDLQPVQCSPVTSLGVTKLPAGLNQISWHPEGSPPQVLARSSKNSVEQVLFDSPPNESRG